MEKDQSIETDKNELKEEHSDNPGIKDQKENNNIKEKEEKILTPEEKISELEDKLSRTFAEMENQRRRFEKEKDEAFEYGGFSFAREALNLIDNLERAKESLKNDESLNNSENLKKIIEHIDIIYKDIISIFKKNNIEPTVSINKKFDPNFHQAMMEIENNEKDPGTIIKEIQKGFTIKNRLLRPALVGVSKRTEKKTLKNEENKEKKDLK